MRKAEEEKKIKRGNKETRNAERKEGRKEAHILRMCTTWQ
jgi:hypothetical protein